MTFRVIAAKAVGARSAPTHEFIRPTGCSAMALMRVCTMFGILALLAGASCFRGEPDAPLNPETFVGTYIYYSVNSDALHGPDELTLRGDGTYSLIIKPSGVLPTKQGRWRLDKDPRPSIVLDRAGYAVRIKGRNIRLEIDDELGYWYQKIE